MTLVVYVLVTLYISTCLASQCLAKEEDPVLAQYTEFPYPEFTELRMEDERSHYAQAPADRLGPVMLVPDLTLENLNHYLFRGEEDFEDNFRVLVAGGGIGDTTMFLAEQLNHTNAQIIYLDFSLESMKIAKWRAGIRYLKSIIFINDRIENIPNL